MATFGLKWTGCFIAWLKILLERLLRNAKQSIWWVSVIVRMVGDST